MNNLDFWSEWEAPDRLVFKILAAFVLTLIVTLLVFQIGEVSYFYDWQITAYLQEVLFPVHSHHSELLESTVNTEISLLLQKVSGGYQLLSPWMNYLFVGLLYTSLMGAMTMLTYVKRFWFVDCMGLFVLILAGSGIGRLGIFGLKNQWAIGLMAVLYIPLAYYFNAINRYVSTLKRFLAFMGVLALSALLLSYGSAVESPILQLAYYSYWPAIGVSVIFIMVIGHEVIYAILILTTQGVSPKASGNTVHFIVLSSIYLLNLVMLYFHGTGYIDWDFYYVNAFLLVGVSAVLGVWGLRGREVLYGNTLAFYPYALWLYLSLAVTCFTTLVFFSLSGNDSALEVIEDAIVFGHIGFGGMFFLYIIVNFIALLMKGLPVYKVAFHEENFPYATARLAGLVAVCAFFFVSDYTPWYHSASGYFNGLGDMNLILNRTETAKTYYKYGATYGNILGKSNGNHKSNYMSGLLEDQPAEVLVSMKGAVRRQPTEYAYASLGRSYEEANRFFDAMFTYQNGLKEFPNSWALRNNLALLYDKTDLADSILYYLDSSKASGWHASVVKSNLLAVGTMRNWSLDAMVPADRLDFQNNQLGFQIYKGRLSAEVDPSPLQSTLLHLYSYSYLKNLGLACALNGNMTYLNIVDQFIAEPRNGDFHQSLVFIKGLNLYRQGFISNAFETMIALRADLPVEDGVVNTLLGKWSMELGAPLQASKFFELSRESGYPWATADLAQMFAQMGDNSVAQFIVHNEIEKLDSSRLDAKKSLVKLEKAVALGNVDWTRKYDFSTEKTDLTELQKLLAGDNKPTLAAEFEMLGMRNPFFEEGVAAAVDYFKTVQKDEDTAYKILLNAITINEYSASLIKAYIDQCFAMGLTNYAEGTILRLYEILPLEEFQAYELEFEEKKSAASANLESW